MLSPSWSQWSRMKRSLEEIILSLREMMVVIKRKGDEFMSIISDFVAKQKEHNTKISEGINGVSGDIQSLNAKIQKLTEQLGNVGEVITEEDKALLAELDQDGASLAGRITDLDAMTPPEVPPVS